MHPFPNPRIVYYTVGTARQPGQNLGLGQITDHILGWLVDQGHGWIWIVFN